MNKAELISEMAKKSGLSNKDTGNALDAFINITSNELKNGGSVQLIGFGTFEVTERAAREGKNPQTNETISIPACKVPKFKPGKVLKELVKQ